MRTRIFCEGPDDRAALRELVTRGFGLKRAKPGPTDKREEFDAPGGLPPLELVTAGSRDKVLILAADVAQFGSASDPVVRIGLSFDANGQSEAQWRAWLEKGLADLKPAATSPGWQVQTAAGATFIVPLPWSSPTPTRYALPDHHNLERVAIQAMATVDTKGDALVGRWVDDMLADGRTTSWKAAIRLWNALQHADTSGPGLFDKVFGQDHALGERVRADLVGTSLWRGLELVIRGPIAS